MAHSSSYTVDSRIKVAWLVTPLEAATGVATLLQSWASHIDLDYFEPVLVVGMENTAMADRILQIGELRVIQMPELVTGRHILFPAVRALSKLIVEEKFDIVHTHLIQSDILGSLVSRFHPNFILVSSALGHLYKSTTESWKKLAYRFVYSALCQRIDCVAAVSFDTRSDLIREFGVRPGNVRVIHNGLSDLFLEDAKDVPPPDFERRVIGTVGALIPEKGVADFIRAANLIRAKLPEVLFVVVGDGPERENLEKQVKQIGLAGHVKFMGWMPSELDTMSTIDIFVMPSHEEGLPYVLLEAMACQRPIVASEVGGVPEAIVDGESGLLFRPGNSDAIADGVLRLLHNPDLAQRLGHQARLRVENEFRARNKVTEVEQMYSEFMAERTRSD